MAAKNMAPLQKKEPEDKFITLMHVEMEMMGDELIILKAAINGRGKHRLMTEQMSPLKELDSAQELIIEEFRERLEREFNYGLQDNLVAKIDRFNGILGGFHCAYEGIFAKEVKKTEFLSNLAIKQRWIIHVLELERMSEKKGGDNRDIKEQRGELDRLWNKQQADFEDFRRLLHESENELRNTVSKLRKEEDARNELQFKNSNLNFDILKLKEELTTIKYDYQKIVEEKGELKQRLAEVAWNLAEERAKKAAVEQPFEIEKPVKQMSENDERDNHSHQQLRNRKNELDEILSRSEGEKKTSIYEKLLKKFGEL